MRREGGRERERERGRERERERGWRRIWQMYMYPLYMLLYV